MGRNGGGGGGGECGGLVAKNVVRPSCHIGIHPAFGTIFMFFSRLAFELRYKISDIIVKHFSIRFPSIPTPVH